MRLWIPGQAFGPPEMTFLSAAIERISHQKKSPAFE